MQTTEEQHGGAAGNPTSPASAPDSKLDWALYLASLGFRVFPLEDNGKRPIIDGWPKRATSDPERIRRFWTDPVLEWERDHNVGVTGGVFLDVDMKNGVNGLDSLFDLLATHGNMPDTLQVVTPSGGYHIYFQHHDGVRNSAGKLGPGLDIRGWHGYVAGPGSTLDDKEYRLIGKTTSVAKCPSWLVELAGKAPRSRTKSTHSAKTSEVREGVVLDSENAIMRAKQYLLEDADVAVEGVGGDLTTFRVAARVKDFGISETLCLELMLDHWNDRCEPPWDPEELAKKVRNAYRYGDEDVGSASAEADFGDASEEADTTLFEPRVQHMPNGKNTKARHWVIGRRLLKGHLSLLVAPPGSSKSTFALHLALSIVTGRKDILGMNVVKKEKVWSYNCEDGHDEMDRRIHAAGIHYDISEEDLLHDGKPAFFVNSGDEKPLRIAAWSEDGKELIPMDMHPIIQSMQKRGIGVLIVDPFAETHPGQENSNEDVGAVARMFRIIAKKTGCAVLLIHHTNKPPNSSSEGRAGNMNTARGASSLMGVARIAMTLESMSIQDAKRYGVPEQDKHLYIRLDDSKSNVALTSSEPTWFKKVSVDVPTEETPDTLKFESVGVLELANIRLAAMSEEEILITAVAAELTQPEMTVSSIAALLAGGSLYQGSNRTTLIRKIKDAFNKPVRVGTRTIVCEALDRGRDKFFLVAKEEEQ